MKITCSGKSVVLELLSTPIVTPTECPACQSILVKDGAHIFCKNEACEGQAFRKLKTWVNKRNIKYLGDELLLELWTRHDVKEPWQLYLLTEDELSKCNRGNGVVGTAAKLIMSELDKSRKATLSDFLGSLAIPMAGRRQIEIMQESCGFTTLADFLTATVAQLEAADGFSAGGSKASTIVKGLKDARPLIEAMLEHVEIVKEEKPTVQPSQGKLSGLSFCLTGSMSRKRSEIEADIKAAGGVACDDVKSDTKYLVQADPTSQSSKSKKALKYGAKIISEVELMKML